MADISREDLDAGFAEGNGLNIMDSPERNDALKRDVLERSGADRFRVEHDEERRVLEVTFDFGNKERIEVIRLKHASLQDALYIAADNAALWHKDPAAAKKLDDSTRNERARVEAQQAARKKQDPKPKNPARINKGRSDPDAEPARPDGFNTERPDKTADA